MKRLMDVALAIIALIVLAPVLLYLVIRIRREMGSPVLFRQVRPGLREKPFEMLKFRTMRDAVDAAGNPLPDAERLTSLGRKLRATSLDELPELINVLKGEMSIVGPRPLLTEYLPLYSLEQARRHEVRPGLTGWAQINGRNTIDWEQKFAMDVWYVDNQSIGLDWKIIGSTIKQALRREGISAKGEATMPKFTGQGQ